jgi:hypothetical protein
MVIIQWQFHRFVWVITVMLWVNRTEETEGISLPLPLIRLPVYDLHLTLSLLFLLSVFVYNNICIYIYEGRTAKCWLWFTPYA